MAFSPSRHTTILFVLGGVLIVGLSLKILDLEDVTVGNFLPAPLLATLLAGAASLL